MQPADARLDDDDHDDLDDDDDDLMRPLLAVLMAVVIAVLATVLCIRLAAASLFLFSDGSDSIAIPDGPYRATCMGRCEHADPHQVAVWLYHRIGPTGAPIDCFARCLYNPGEDDVLTPLPLDGEHWRTATTQWCLLTRDLDTAALYYPAAHCQNTQQMSLTSFGPMDCECWYPRMSTFARFVYEDPLAQATIAAASLSLRRDRPGAYRLRFRREMTDRELAGVAGRARVR